MNVEVSVNENKRISKDMYYLRIAEAVAARSTCIRRNYGAVIVKDDAIVSTGYNGSPRGEDNCIDKEYCKREERGAKKGEHYEWCVAIHAEDNAISTAGRDRCIGSTIYIVGLEHNKGMYADPRPCEMCRRKIVNSGIKRVVGLLNNEAVDIDFSGEKAIFKKLE